MLRSHFVRASQGAHFSNANKLAGKMAVGEGFEPPRPFGLMVFKTTAIGHSAIPPFGKKKREQRMLSL